MSRVYEYWCDNVRRTWSRFPCPQCDGAKQEQRTDKDGIRYYWFTAECEEVCVACHDAHDSTDSEPEGH